MSIDPLSLRQYSSSDPLIASASMPPSSITPDSVQSALPTKYYKKTIRPLGGNSVSNGAPIDFNLNFANGAFLKSGSVYITADFDVNGPSNGVLYGFKGAASTSQRLFNRMTISYGSNQIEDIQFYGAWCSDVVLPYLTSAQNTQVQAALFGGICGLSNQVPFTHNTGAASNNMYFTNGENYAKSSTKLRVCIPIMSSFLSGGASGEDIPLFACSSPINIRLFTETVQDSIVCSAGTVTSWTLSDIQLIVTEITPDQSYVSTLIQKMNTENKAYPIMINTVNSFQPALSTSTSVLQTLNCRSLNAVAVSFCPASQNGNQTYNGWNAAPTGSSSDVGTLKLYVDNQLINQWPDGMKYPSDRLAENLMAVYGNITDADISLPFVNIGNDVYKNGTFLGQYFTNFISTQCYFDADTSKRGQPCSNIRVDVTVASAASGDALRIYSIYEKIVFFQAAGGMTIVS
jgi:hypothetical protein